MKKLILFDMDGTVYLGDKLIDGAKETFDYLREKGISYVFLTNNSSHSLSFYGEKISHMGIKAEADNFYSSVETTVKYLRDNNYRRIYVLGVKSFKEKLSKYFTLETIYSKNTVDAVVASFDTELIYSELKDACLYLQDGAEFIATNMDYRCPIEDGYYIPDCGGMCEWMRMCTGKTARFLGKPAPEMIYQVMEKYGVTKEETMMVGDRYYTDIKAGLNAGIDSVAVLSGETTLEEFQREKEKPTFIIKSVKNLPEIL